MNYIKIITDRIDSDSSSSSEDRDAMQNKF